MIVRDIEPLLKRHLFEKGGYKILILYGPRQTGKTTLVKKLLAKYPKDSAYFNCDYPDVRETFAHDNVRNVGSVVRDLKFVVIDEAQRVENIGLTLKILADENPRLQIVATGSSSFELSNRIQEPLTGRKREFHLYPFSFMELARGKSFFDRQQLMTRMMRFGGYPEVALYADRKAEEQIKEITGSYLFRDIFTFQHLKKPELLMKLLRLVALQVGSQVSFHELAQKMGVDQTVVQKYLHLLEEAFVIFRLGSFKRNLRNEIGKSRKIYFWDLGVRNAIIGNFGMPDMRVDVGALWENFCISERLKYLRGRGLDPNVYFWRTYAQKEIDYIEENTKGAGDNGGNGIFAFEFKWSSGVLRSLGESGDKKVKVKVKQPKEFLEAYKKSRFMAVTPQNFEEFLEV